MDEKAAILAAPDGDKTPACPPVDEMEAIPDGGRPSPCFPVNRMAAIPAALVRGRFSVCLQKPYIYQCTTYSLKGINSWTLYFMCVVHMISVRVEITPGSCYTQIPSRRVLIKHKGSLLTFTYIYH
jgi:hypothetical protein